MDTEFLREEKEGLGATHEIFGAQRDQLLSLCLHSPGRKGNDSARRVTHNLVCSRKDRPTPMLHSHRNLFVFQIAFAGCRAEFLNSSPERTCALHQVKRFTTAADMPAKTPKGESAAMRD
ncbi:hypothetical protein [Streptomyces formicae]|uniref:hypothetical protein n=1 Tax=Streptomyces formicae TaxID=1616117 RepID=UPI001F2E4330|nr:hypothetical protein [Streptomyces formicae]